MFLIEGGERIGRSVSLRMGIYLLEWSGVIIVQIRFQQYMGNIYESCCLEPSSQSQTKQLVSTSPKEVSSEMSSGRIEEVAVEQNSIRHLNWRDFELVRYLCKSQFGQIVAVRLRSSNRKGKEYAMKIVEKAKIKEENLLQSSYLQNQIVAEDNPFIVKVYHVSQNNKNIYILMEFVERRDLYYYLFEEMEEGRMFSEDIIRNIVAEAMLGLEFLHSKEIIYRELKPENLLCTPEGHIKLTDYIFSRVEKANQPTLTYLGNVEYLAPQMLEKTVGYTRSADIWSLGVLLYELKVGATPFKSQDPMMTQSRIQVAQFKYPSDLQISQQLKDLIKVLLQTDPQKRPRLPQIKNHPFFKSIDWREIEQRRNETGLCPIINRYNLNVRGGDDNPPARDYMYGDSREFKATPHEFTLTTQESFKNIQEHKDQ